MQKLVSGIHHFQREVFAARKQLFEDLAEGQQPLALFITCSDSRISPSLITQSQPGELFILRNAGNIVPSYAARAGGEAATIEYAVSVLKVKDVVICGHSHCGAMKGLLDPPSLAKLPAVAEFLQNSEATRRIIEENYTHVTDPEERLLAAIEENVLVQLENLRTHPAIAAALARRQLSLHGWVYHFESGAVYDYDPESNDFLPLELQPAPKLDPARGEVAWI